MSCALPGAVASLRTRWGSTFPKPLVRQQKRNIRFASVPFPLAYIPRHRLRRKEENHIAIFHCPIQIIKRSVGRSAVAAAAYRSGERLTNEWDGLTHDYTHKPGIVHKEIMLSDLGFENCSNAESYRGRVGLCRCSPANAPEFCATT